MRLGYKGLGERYQKYQGYQGYHELNNCEYGISEYLVLSRKY